MATAAELAAITHAKIHPAIGIARVGNSPDGYFLAPEVLAPLPPRSPECYRDAAGNLSRQAVRFRVYGYRRDAAGRELVVAELTSADALIEWTVEVANTKASWYESKSGRPLDIPEAESDRLAQRNLALDRRMLAIEPGARRIRSQDGAGQMVRLHGAFCGLDVYLGELRLDPAGRLLFLGGRGAILNTSVRPPLGGGATVIGDDISDGPVEATVRLKGATERVVPCRGAWVLTAPPAYAPEIVAGRTLYDVLDDVARAGGRLPPLPPGRTVSFADEVLPIFKRLGDLGWVSAVFGREFGAGGPGDLLAPARLALLRALPPVVGPDPNERMRREVLASFRGPAADAPDDTKWPPQLGDDASLWTAGPSSPRAYLSLSAGQLDCLQHWAEGRFHNRPGDPALAAQELDHVDRPRQPEVLDRASLTFCAAEAFHPGIDIAWVIRQNANFELDEGFRLRRTRHPPSPRTYPASLDPAAVFSADSPWLSLGPGALTRWLAVPWQNDFALCAVNPLALPFWPARVPDSVWRRQDYLVAADPTRPMPERRAAFQHRDMWMFPNPYAIKTGSAFAALPLVQRVQPPAGQPWPGEAFVAG